MMRGSLFLPLILAACTVPPAPPIEPKAAVSWPVEPYRPTEMPKKQPEKKPAPTPKPALTTSNPCSKEEADKARTEQEQIIKKLDCLLETKP